MRLRPTPIVPATSPELLAQTHSAVLQFAMWVIPAIFVGEWIIELADGDPRTVPRWYIYLGFWLIAWFLARRNPPNALHILMPAMAFLALGTAAEILSDLDVGVPDHPTSLSLLVGVGMLTGFMAYERFWLAIGVSTLAVAIVAVLSGFDDDLAGDDLIVRVVAPVLLVSLASWLIYRLRTELDRKAFALLESLDARDQLIGSVSHELRTPLTAIAGFSQELVDNWPKYTSEQALELTGLVAAQAHEMGDLIEDLLVAARDESAISLRPEAVDLRMEVDNVLDTGIVPTLTGAREGAVSGHAIGWADPMRCRQIIRNLLSNAHRYGGADIRVEIGRSGTDIYVTVSDDGSDLASKDTNRIFDAYYSVHAAKRAEGSIGLGLPVSRSLARLMGGDLTCEVGDRTSFRMSLPAFHTDDSSR